MKYIIASNGKPGLKIYPCITAKLQVSSAEFSVSDRVTRVVGVHCHHLRQRKNSPFVEMTQDNSESVCFHLINKHLPPKDQTFIIKWHTITCLKATIVHVYT